MLSFGNRLCAAQRLARPKSWFPFYEKLYTYVSPRVSAFGFLNSKKNSFHGNYMRRYGIQKYVFPSFITSVYVPTATYAIQAQQVFIPPLKSLATQKEWMEKIGPIILFLTVIVSTWYFAVLIFCYQNCSDLLWKKWYFVTKIVLTYCEKKLFQWSRNSWLKAENLQIFWDH